jgi:hypothetical protein
MFSIKPESQEYAFHYRLAVGASLLCCVLTGCSTLWESSLPPASPPLKVVVGPLAMTAPISKSTEIYSFEETPTPELEPVLRTQLIEEIRIKAQRFLSEYLGRQPGFTVIPFDDVRRLQTDLGPSEGPWTEKELRLLGKHAGADQVLTGEIIDYGAVNWKFWATGFVIDTTVSVAIVGAATGWNPAGMGAALGFELLHNVPIYFGGAYIFGWAFRPVRVEIEAIQLGECDGSIWVNQEMMVTIPRKTMAAYPPEQRDRKEFQLEANLRRAMDEVAEHAGRDLRLQPCTEEGHPAKRSGLPFFSLLGWGH